MLYKHNKKMTPKNEKSNVSNNNNNDKMFKKKENINDSRNMKLPPPQLSSQELLNKNNNVKNMNNNNNNTNNTQKNVLKKYNPYTYDSHRNSFDVLGDAGEYDEEESDGNGGVNSEDEIKIDNIINNNLMKNDKNYEKNNNNNNHLILNEKNDKKRDRLTSFDTLGLRMKQYEESAYYRKELDPGQCVIVRLDQHNSHLFSQTGFKNKHRCLLYAVFLVP